MAKAIKTTKILSCLYQDHLRDKIRWQNQLIMGSLFNVGLTFNSREGSAYTTLTGKTKKNLRVVIGGGMVSKIAGLPETFSDKATLEPFFGPIVMAFYGLDYHEMGHAKFTDMTCDAIIKYKEPKYIGFLHSLFNILEDPIVEASMDMLYKDEFPYEIRPHVYFDYMIDQLFMSKGESYRDDGTQAGFLDYLLLNLRIGKDNIKGENKIFEKYRSDLMPLISDVIYEPDPTERIYKTITLGEWIIENITEFNWEMPEPKEKISGKMTGEPVIPIPSKSRVSGGSIPGVPGSDEGEKGSGSEETPVSESDGKSGDKKPDGESEDGPEESGDEKEDEPEEGEEEKPEEEESSTPERDPADDIDPNDEGIDDIFNDVIHDGDDHEWVVAKDEYEINNLDKINERLDQQIEQFIDCITDVSKFLKLFKGRVKPREIEGFTRGKLNLRRALKDDMVNGCDTKIFNQRVPRGQDKDLAVSLLCDNSGSMSGDKSEVCSRAAIALGQACEWSGIPFECNAFTKTEDSMYGTCITITEKSFDDSFEKVKPFFAINDSTLIRYLTPSRYIPTFRGNSEEINLYYIWKKFARVDHKTKLLFVLCDGATTGSRSDLKDIVRRIEIEDGIIVVGIGIMCSEVANIYPHHKLFSSQEDLEANLANYLIDTISKYAV